MTESEIEVKLRALKSEHDGLYWKFVALERKVNSLESELRRVRRY